VISPLVQHLPKLPELMHHYGMTTLELNKIGMRPGKDGRLTPVACDFNEASIVTIRSGSGWGSRITVRRRHFGLEQEVNQLRTHPKRSSHVIFVCLVRFEGMICWHSPLRRPALQSLQRLRARGGNQGAPAG
jgi:hypothetical protein